MHGWMWAPSTLLQKDICSNTQADEAVYWPSQISEKKRKVSFLSMWWKRCIIFQLLSRKDSFINLIQELSPQTSVMSRRTQGRRNYFKFASKVNGLKEILKRVKHLCTRADIWSTSVSSFIGMTAQWIKPDTLEHQSAAFACCHFFSLHTNNRITDILNEIHSKYKVRVVLWMHCCNRAVTDNGANFLKAFKGFSVPGVCVRMNRISMMKKNSVLWP